MKHSRTLMGLLQEIRSRSDVVHAEVEETGEGFKAWARCWGARGSMTRIVHGASPEQAASDLLDAIRATDLPASFKARVAARQDLTRRKTRF